MVVWASVLSFLYRCSVFRVGMYRKQTKQYNEGAAIERVGKGCKGSVHVADETDKKSFALPLKWFRCILMHTRKLSA